MLGEQLIVAGCLNDGHVIRVIAETAETLELEQEK